MMGNKVWVKRIGIAFLAWYMITSPIAAAHTVKSGGSQVKHAGTQAGVFLEHLQK